MRSGGIDDYYQIGLSKMLQQRNAFAAMFHHRNTRQIEFVIPPRHFQTCGIIAPGLLPTPMIAPNLVACV